MIHPGKTAQTFAQTSQVLHPGQHVLHDRHRDEGHDDHVDEVRGGDAERGPLAEVEEPEVVSDARCRLVDSRRVVLQQLPLRRVAPKKECQRQQLEGQEGRRPPPRRAVPAGAVQT